MIVGKPIKKLKVSTDAASLDRAHSFNDKLNDMFANIGGDIFVAPTGDKSTTTACASAPKDPSADDLKVVQRRSSTRRQESIEKEETQHKRKERPREL